MEWTKPSEVEGLLRAVQSEATLWRAAHPVWARVRSLFFQPDPTPIRCVPLSTTAGSKHFFWFGQGRAHLPPPEFEWGPKRALGRRKTPPMKRAGPRGTFPESRNNRDTVRQYSATERAPASRRISRKILKSFDLATADARGKRPPPASPSPEQRDRFSNARSCGKPDRRGTAARP